MKTYVNEKTIKENIVAKVKEFLQKEYRYAYDEKTNTFNFEIYTDYDEIDSWQRLIDDKLHQYKDLEEFLCNELYASDWLLEAQYLEFDNIINEINNNELFTIEEEEYLENEESLYDVLSEFTTVNYPIEDIIESVEVNVVLSLKTTNSPYSLDSTIDFEETIRYGLKNNDNEEEILDELKDYENLEEFFQTQNVTFEELVNYFKIEEKSDNKFLHTFYQEINNSYGYNNIVFLKTMNLKEFFELKEKESITITNEFIIGLVDFGNGGGSILETELNNDFMIKTEKLNIELDSEYRYGVTDIYGMIDFNK